MNHGIRDAHEIIESLMDDPLAQIEKRVQASHEVRYFNKHR